MSQLVRDWQGNYVEAQPDFDVIVAEHAGRAIVWSGQNGQYQVRYGLQVKTFWHSSQAAEEYASCVLHYAKCEGLIREINR